MNSVPLIAGVASSLYALSGYGAWGDSRRLLRWAPLAIVLHLAVLFMTLLHGGFLRIGVTEAASLFAWQAALLLWLFSLREPVAINGAALYPLTALFMLWAVIEPSPVGAVPLGDWQVSLHVLLSLLSAGVLTVAAVQAAALALQDRLLHRHSPSPASSRMPPLQTMERLLFELVALGFVLLSLTLLSGLWFVHDWMAQHLAHKTVLSICAWTIFGVLLWGRWHYGWRGRSAIRWALGGYGMLILAYFGTKFILEQLLGEQWVWITTSS